MELMLVNPIVEAINIGSVTQNVHLTVPGLAYMLVGGITDDMVCIAETIGMNLMRLPDYFMLGETIIITACNEGE